MHTILLRATTGAVAALGLCYTGVVGAQSPRVGTRPVPTVRLDGIGGSARAVQAGLGIRFPVSNEFSVGGTAAVGISSAGGSGRGDLFGQFSLDPYHQSAWEPYVGGGATVRLDGGHAGERVYLLGFLGANWPRTGSVAPGIELGIGGGVRIGVTLRWATK